MGRWIYGTDGQVVSDLFNGVADAIKWQKSQTVPVVNVTVFNSTGQYDYEPGDATPPTGSVTLRHSNDLAPPVADKTIAVLTLRTASAAPYIQHSGSAFLTEFPDSREIGNDAMEVEYAFQGTGSWATSVVAS